MIRKCFAGFSSFSTPKPFEVRSIVRVIAFCLLIMAVDGATSAATLPAAFSETLVANGLASPTAMDFALDGRLFVCLQGGQLRVIKNGSLLPTPFVTLTVNSDG